MPLDATPVPANWAFSRILASSPDEPEATKGWLQRRNADQFHAYTIQTANFELLCRIDGLFLVSHIYRELFHRTKIFVTTVEELVAATTKQAPLRWAEAACLIVDFSITILRIEKVQFHRFLNSQRKSIYWILDEALLRICLDQWEDCISNTIWDRATQPISVAVTSAQQEQPGWAELDLKDFLDFHPDAAVSVRCLMGGYFERTSAFLRESLRLYEIWRTIRMSKIGQLPNELANVVIQEIFDYEKLPSGNLRALYIRKGKGRAQ